MQTSVLLVLQLLVTALAQGRTNSNPFSRKELPEQQKKSFQTSAERRATKLVAVCQFTSAIIC